MSTHKTGTSPPLHPSNTARRLLRRACASNADREIADGSSYLYGDVVVASLKPCGHVVKMSRSQYIELLAKSNGGGLLVHCKRCARKANAKKRIRGMAPVLLVLGVCSIVAACTAGPLWLRIVNGILGTPLLVAYDYLRRKNAN